MDWLARDIWSEVPVLKLFLSVQAERDVELMAKWRHCALSGEKLKPPAMGCELGR